MTSKQNILFHFDAVNACDSRQYDHALGLFNRIQDPPAVILFNIASCHLHSGNIKQAIEIFKSCLAKDVYMVAGHFQLAVCYVLQGDTQSAIESFQKAATSFRVNEFVDYKQLHMTAKIYAAEVDYNLALLYLFSPDVQNAESCLLKASQMTMPANRKVMVEDALSHLQMEDWQYFGESALERLIRLPEEAIFRPNKAKLEGIQSSTNFMASAKVLSASKEEYSFVGFVGAAKLQSATGKSPRPSPPNTPPNIPPPRLPPTQFQPIRPPKDQPASLKVPPARPAPAKPPTNATLLNVNGNSPLKKKPARPASPAPLNPPKGKPPVPVLRDKKVTKVSLSCDFSFTVGKDVLYDDLLVAMENKLISLTNNIRQQKIKVTSDNDASPVALTSEDWKYLQKSSSNEIKLSIKED